MKVNVYVAAEGDASARRICWYTGTSDAQVERAIRIQLKLPRGTEFLLRDADGDVVPASSALPNGQHYTIVVHEDAEMQDIASTSTAINASITKPITSTSNDESSMMTQEQATSTPSPKRRRLESEEVVDNVATAPAVDPMPTVATPTRSEAVESRPIGTIIAQFVDTFTRPIANDDNVSFIPNTGRFGLYELYCQLVQDKKCHPKREDVFYKMTSMHGKVDRQRVNRYYQCTEENGDGKQFVQCKPQGKGVLIRRYRKVGTVEELEDVVRTAPFISWLGLDAKEVVPKYERFVNGFVPIAKGEYRAQSTWVQPSTDAIQQALRA
ncbi:hypothetical protein PHMEG_0003201 [Phytophthora megakarya]|uniref:Uncharacterized protein n=1 Tax=Phytophthora megakarya TaxID=4795 RepID=A0A225WWV8_9STRA|nr:hypothetical protein PHMEG_0003201 [Phytophthora megakarya]